jgi:hypothetical protein
MDSKDSESRKSLSTSHNIIVGNCGDIWQILK